MTGEGEEVDEKEDKGDMSMSRKKCLPCLGKRFPTAVAMHAIELVSATRRWSSLVFDGMHVRRDAWERWRWVLFDA